MWLHLATGFTGLFLDGAFGLFFCAPLWWILVPGVVGTARDKSPLLFDSAVVGLPYLIVVSLTDGWYGGWSPPFRFGIALLPLLALAAVPALDRWRSPAPRVVLGALGALTLLTGLVWMLHPGPGRVASVRGLSAAARIQGVRKLVCRVRKGRTVPPRASTGSDVG